MSADSPVWMVYITASNTEEAEALSSALIQAKSAACVNILGPITSMYEWKGVVEKTTEVALIAKTTEAGYPALERIVKDNHSYECPCIVAWPVEKGNAPFLDWIRGAVV